MDYFRSEKLNEHMTAIHTRTYEIMYLIEGKDRAVLVDTCLGIRGLRAFVETLTDKPLTVLITHGHVDHALGTVEFGEAYMNPKDRFLYEAHRVPEVRKGYIRSTLQSDEAWIEDDLTYVYEPQPVFKDLEDGMVFDLGDIHVEAYALPGHTPGSMVLLVPEERVLITGDACNTFTFLFDENTVPVKPYRDNVQALEEKLQGRYDFTYLSHREVCASRNLMKSVIEVADEILAETTDDVPFEFMGHTNYIAKRVNEMMLREDGGEGNIVYNKDRLY